MLLKVVAISGLDMIRLANLFLKLLFGKHGQFIAKYLLRVEYFLVVHFFDERVVLDAIGLKKLHVSHLESLPDRLGNELGLGINHQAISLIHPIKRDVISFT